MNEGGGREGERSQHVVWLTNAQGGRMPPGFVVAVAMARTTIPRPGAARTAALPAPWPSGRAQPPSIQLTTPSPQGTFSQPARHWQSTACRLRHAQSDDARSVLLIDAPARRTVIVEKTRRSIRRRPIPGALEPFFSRTTERRRPAQDRGHELR